MNNGHFNNKNFYFKIKKNIFLKVYLIYCKNVITISFGRRLQKQ